jgi:hypothetical protein
LSARDSQLDDGIFLMKLLGKVLPPEPQRMKFKEGARSATSAAGLRALEPKPRRAARRLAHIVPLPAAVTRLRGRGTTDQLQG